MKKIKIIYNRDVCIDCGSCTSISPQNFALNENKETYLVNGVKVKSENETSGQGKFEVTKEVDETEFENLKMARDACPTGAIEIEELG